jgi:hypothetical protein
MPWVGFEPTIPKFDRAKAIQALDRAATAIGLAWNYPQKIEKICHMNKAPQVYREFWAVKQSFTNEISGNYESYKACGNAVF